MMGQSALFVTWNGGGNTTPVLALSAQLAAAGGSAVVLGEPSQAERFERAGVRFIARAPGGLWDPSAIAADTRLACMAEAPDVVVVDYMLPTANCGAEAAGAPVAVLVHTLFGALLVDGAPAPMSMAASVEAVNEVRSHLDLAACSSFGELLSHTDRVLVPCPPELDVMPTPLPDNVRYVAPLFESAGSHAGWVPPAGDDPLVVVSLGTTPMDEAPALQRVVDALGEEPVRVLATVGDHLDPTSIPAPANCTVSAYLPHAAVLPHASAVVSHGGLGTVLNALAHGLPLVCLPLGREQPDNAAAAERMGACRTLAIEAARPEIAGAINEVLNDSRYRSAAASVQQTISAGADAIDELTTIATSG